MKQKTRVGVLVSGAGTNLRALVEATLDPTYPAQVVSVITNRRAAGALQICKEYGIPSAVFAQRDFDGDAAARDRAMRDHFIREQVKLVVCAGYDRVIHDEFLTAFPDALLNLHPSLLPAFAGGMDAIERALAAGATRTGCTVHYLEPGEIDGGARIAQSSVEIAPGDTPATLRQRVHEQEWELLPKVVAWWANGQVQRVGDEVHVLSPPDAQHVAGTPVFAGGEAAE